MLLTCNLYSSIVNQPNVTLKIYKNMYLLILLFMSTEQQTCNANLRNDLTNNNKCQYMYCNIATHHYCCNVLLRQCNTTKLNYQYCIDNLLVYQQSSALHDIADNLVLDPKKAPYYSSHHISISNAREGMTTSSPTYPVLVFFLKNK